MATSFEEIMNGMVNVSLGAAALAADKGKEIIDDLNARGAKARDDAAQSDFARSMADIFEQAGGAFSSVTERLNEQGATVAERILDELIVARVRPMATGERSAFVTHVKELVDAAPMSSINVPVDSVESVDDGPGAEAAEAADAETTEA